MKKIISILLIETMAFGLCACGSKKYDDLERRVSNIEYQLGISQDVETVSASPVSNNNECTLSEYITNYDEVLTIIQDKFGSDQLSFVENTRSSELATLKQFGSGNYTVLVNDVNVMVCCDDHIACWVGINMGNKNDITNTPTYDQKRQEQYSVNSVDAVNEYVGEVIDGQ